MRLLYSPTSPYARKVLVAAIEKGVEARIAVQPMNPLEDPPELLAGNPLAKVPCLLLDDGAPLYDSVVICEYLDALAPQPRLIPPDGPPRWAALRRQALADGILDAAVALRLEGLRPQAQRSPEWQARWRAGILRAVRQLEAELPQFAADVDLGAIAAACALGYLDFRHPGIDWRSGHAPLTDWFERAAQRPAMVATLPPA